MAALTAEVPAAEAILLYVVEVTKAEALVEILAKAEELARVTPVAETRETEIPAQSVVETPVQSVAAMFAAELATETPALAVKALKRVEESLIQPNAVSD